MRDAFSSSLVAAAKHNSRVLMLTGDHGYALFDEFRKSCPTQYLNAGVAEQNMVGVAAGLAKGGFRPFVYGLSAFVPIRVLEQIKMDICYEELPVILIGDGAGLVYSHLGSSHQSTEDIAALRAIPNINIFSPADAFEMTYCMESALASEQSCYIRMGKSDVGQVHSAPFAVKNLGDLVPVLTIGAKNTIVATGSMVKTALDIAHELGGLNVWSAPTLKPINESQVATICATAELVFTLEEHSTFGGLGSIIAELAAAQDGAKIERIGIQDRFSQYCGSYNYLLQEHALDKPSILDRIRKIVSN